MVRITEWSHTADVIVIGAGVIGCSIALRLAQNRLRVCVFDRSEPGAEASAAAAGMIAPQGEMTEPDEFFRLCEASRDLYASFAAEIKELSGRDVDYRRDGTMLVAIEEPECHQLESIYQAQTRLGLPVECLSAKDIRERVPQLSHDIRYGLSIPGDHCVDSERLTVGLVQACRQLGIAFCTHTAVARLNVRHGRVESVGIAESFQTSTFSAGQFILAAGCWSRELVEPLGIVLPMEPCRGQMLEFDTATDFPMVVRAGGHYLVPRSGGRIAVGSTMEYVGFEKAVTGEGLRSILEGVGRLTPLVKDFRFRRAWAGLRPDTADHLPILGCGELTNFFFATGHFRNGILLAPVTAQLITELVLTGSTSRSIEAFKASRYLRG